MSNRVTSLAVTVLSSIRAGLLPIHPKGPMENGANASLCLIISGLLYQRSGTKESGSGYIPASTSR